MRIPPDLQEADRMLAKYGRWAMDRFKKQHCASMEGRYKPPAYPGDDVQPELLLADFKAMDVQRALNDVPKQYRRVLQAEYIPQRLPMVAQRRILKLTRSTWEGSHLAGLRMFKNLYEAHTGKKAAKAQVDLQPAKPAQILPAVARKIEAERKDQELVRLALERKLAEKEGDLQQEKIRA